MIKAQIVADSKNEFGNRITTMLVTFPRYILAEFNTHRMFSRNTASSRAIPFDKMVDSIQNNSFFPIAWQKDHKGMQGTEYLDKLAGYADWEVARDCAIASARRLHDKGVTKQICNRLLEPFMWVTAIVTATEWENFFALRCPKYEFGDNVGFYNTFRSKKDALIEINEVLGESDFNDTSNYLQWAGLNKGQAEIHMMALAEVMWDAYNESIPKQLKIGEWHIPFENEIVKLIPSPLPLERGISLQQGVSQAKVKVATVMAARTSYTVVGADQKPMTYDRSVELHDEMKSATPVHASPFEHCAECGDDPNKRSRNFTGGWIQYRDILGI